MNMKEVAQQTKTVLALKNGVSKRPVQSIWIKPVKGDKS